MLRAKQLPHRNDEALDALQLRAEMIIRKVFGESSKYIVDLNSIEFHPMVFPADREYYESSWNNGQKGLVNLVTTMIDELNLFDEDSVILAESNDNGQKLSKRIFVVHGHDEAMKQSVARVVERLGIELIILHEQPNRGRTIIEKFTDYSNVGFAIILLSPDDIGYDAKKQPVIEQARARQNVILEMGFFLGKLGRERVFVLYLEDGKLELPSDYSGVLYTKYDAAGNWRFELVKELQAVGYDVDANKLVRGN